jgi:hypothetical protein
MDQRRLPEDSSSESLTRKDFLFSVCLLTINEFHFDAGRSRRRRADRDALCVSGQERRRVVEAQEEAEEAHCFERQSEEGSIILSHNQPIRNTVSTSDRRKRAASIANQYRKVCFSPAIVGHCWRVYRDRSEALLRDCPSTARTREVAIPGSVRLVRAVWTVIHNSGSD